MDTSEKNLTPEESLEIISRNIEKSRQDMEKAAGSPMLLWGCLLLVFSLAIYFLWNITLNPSWNYLWFAMTAIGFAVANFLPINRMPKVEGFISVVLGKVWLAAGILMVATPTITVIAFRIIKEIVPSTIFAAPIFFPTTLIIAGMLGLAITITGFIIKNGWISAAGILCGTLGAAFAISFNGPEQILIFTGIAIIGLIIPGFIINAQIRHNG